MNRIEVLAEKYKLAERTTRKIASDSKFTPYYWSIYSNNRVGENNNESQAIADDPDFIISAIVDHHFCFGNRMITHIICYKNTESHDKYYSSISLTKWTLKNIKIWNRERVDGATFELIDDYNESFTFHLDSPTPFHSVQDLWTLFVEIDKNCNTTFEAEQYYNAFREKLEQKINSEPKVDLEAATKIYLENPDATF